MQPFADKDGGAGVSARRNSALSRAMKTRRRGALVRTPCDALIHVESYGPETAPPVVLIHGASGSTYDMTFRLAPALSEQYRVYVVDRPGFGHSPHLPEESLGAQARVIRHAIATLEPRRPLVLGQSYGGAVALRWALDAPENPAALVLVSSPSHSWDSAHPTLHRTLAKPVLGWWAAELIHAFTPGFIVDSRLSDVFAPQDVPDGYAEHFQPRNAIFPTRHRLNARQRIALKSEMADMVARYAMLSLPIESLHGTADDTVPDQIHALPFDASVTSNRLTRLEGIGHMPHHVATPQVVSAVRRAALRAALH